MKFYDEDGTQIGEIKNCNGKVIEYNNNKITFLGEYINGEKNCNGIETFHGQKKYEGEFYKEERHGKGKEYVAEKETEYDGEFKYGFKNGKIKEYSKGKLIYDGEYLNDEKNGKGKAYNYLGELLFDGEYINGNRLIKKIKIVHSNKIEIQSLENLY